MTQYNTIGSRYDFVKTILFNTIERSNLKKAIGPLLKDTAVLDLACGTGFYSHLLLEWGAYSVTGVDISSTMISFAQRRLSETKYAAQATFHQGDCLEPEKYLDSEFRLVVGAWYLNYAKSLDELTRLFRTVGMNLARDGVFVTICPHPTNDVASYMTGLRKAPWANSGLEFVYGDRLPGDAGYQFRCMVLAPPGQPDKAVYFTCYHLKKRLYEEAARAGGLRGKMQWHVPQLPGDKWRAKIGLDGDDEAWRRLQQYPLFSILYVWKE